jgi:hypothetical protein
VERIRHIPCIAVQGRLDFVTPVRTAYDLHRAWPEMELRVVPVSDVPSFVCGSKLPIPASNLCRVLNPACARTAWMLI